MNGRICDHCDDRRASYGVNVIRVDTDADGKVTTDSRDEDWCEECVKHHLDYRDKTEPKVGDTWTDKGTWSRGFNSKETGQHGTFSRTYTIEDAPRRAAPFRLAPACP